MPEIKIINENPITMAEVREYLEAKKKSKKELNFRENKSSAYINSFVKIKDKDAEALKKELETLDIVRLKDKHIVKLVDMLPKTLDELRMILSGDEITLKTEDLNKISDIIKKYV